MRRDRVSNHASVIITNFNRASILLDCLESLRGQSFGEFSTIVVDNASSDRSVQWVRDKFPEVRIIELSDNLGYAKATNIGIEASAGEYVVLLNNDTVVREDFLSELIQGLESSESVGFAASKLLVAAEPSLADGCGDFYSQEGVAGKIGHFQPAERYRDAKYVFGASGGAAAYRRSMLQEIGAFDEDFFITHEDSDLSFRAQLMGYKCTFVPSAIVHHHVGATIGRGSDMAAYYAQRNMEFVYLKNMPSSLLARYWPLHILANLMLLVAYWHRGQLGVFLRAKRDAARMARLMLNKRKEIQPRQRVSDAYIDSILEKGWLKSQIREKLRGLAGSSSQQRDRT